MSSLGESRVRTSFNPSQNDTVSTIKQDSAALINKINELPVPEKCTQNPGEFLRLKSLALTAIEEAAMWAVKAATI
ncbi:Acb2/Tad1 domain-containing protein [Tellurirhabdus bombi]